MKDSPSNKQNGNSKRPTVLVAVDFSHCSRLALRRAKSWASTNGGKILVLHIIDQDFVRHCIYQHLGAESEIKEKVFINSKKKLREVLRGEGMDDKNSQMIVCEGTPCMEINRKGVENDVEMIIMGSKGNSGDMKAIFFGSTTEKVLRFIKRPVLCIPPKCDYNLKGKPLESSSPANSKEIIIFTPTDAVKGIDHGKDCPGIGVQKGEETHSCGIQRGHLNLCQSGSIHLPFR